MQHRWGQKLEALGPAFDVIVACGESRSHGSVKVYCSVGSLHVFCTTLRVH